MKKTLSSLIFLCSLSATSAVAMEQPKEIYRDNDWSVTQTEDPVRRQVKMLNSTLESFPTCSNPAVTAQVEKIIYDYFQYGTREADKTYSYLSWADVSRVITVERNAWSETCKASYELTDVTDKSGSVVDPDVGVPRLDLRFGLFTNAVKAQVIYTVEEYDDHKGINVTIFLTQ